MTAENESSTRPLLQRSDSKTGVSKTLSARNRVEELIIGAKSACSRPLYDEILRCRSQRGTVNNSNPVRDDALTWEGTLREATGLLPFMTATEHGIFSRCASIYLLGFLSPLSTGNMFSTLRYHLQRGSPTDQIFAMDLEERLESTCTRFAAHEQGAVGDWGKREKEDAMESFILNGLAPFLSGRPAHETEIDLIHLTAMVIAPRTSPETIPITGAALNRSNKPSWARAKRLMENDVAMTFEVSYAHRMMLVDVVRSSLMLPEREDERGQEEEVISFSSPLVDGAVSHLRASLHAFGAESSQDAMDARAAIVELVVQCGDDVCIKEEFDALMHTVVTRCFCGSSDTIKFCEHEARGALLVAFIVKHNGARHHADLEFIRNALKSLSGALSKQLKMSSPSTNQGQGSPCPCHVGALFEAAASLMYFLFEDTETDEDQTTSNIILKKAETQQIDAITNVALQFLQHDSPIISKHASIFLSVALSYSKSSDDKTKQLVTLLEVIQNAIKGLISSDKKSSSPRWTRGLMACCITASRVSVPFGVGLTTFLVNEWSNATKNDSVDDPETQLWLASFLNDLVSSQPLVGLKIVKKLDVIFEKDLDEAARTRLCSAVLSCRQALLFSSEKAGFENSFSLVSSTSLDVKDSWIRYKLACHALHTGNFAAAEEHFNSLSEACTLSEESYTWLTLLCSISEAEKHLNENGGKGLPSALSLLHAAEWHVESMFRDGNDANHTSRFAFLRNILLLRIDFLEIIVVLRQACREIRMTGILPKHNTRTALHLKNAGKCFHSLAARYLDAFRRHGLFVCQQSRSALRTLGLLCEYLGTTAGRFLPELLGYDNSEEEATDCWPFTGNQAFPVTRLLKKLQTALEEYMDKSVDQVVRVTALCEMAEGILLVPPLIPIAMTTPQRVAISTLQVSVDQDYHDGLIQKALSMVDVAPIHELSDSMEGISVYPGAPFRLIVNGSIPNELKQIATIPFSELLFWPTITLLELQHSDRNEDGEEDEEMEEDPPEIPAKQDLPPFSCQLPVSGTFYSVIEIEEIPHESLYRLDFQLGCRDRRCGEWMVPSEVASVVVQVSRAAKT